MVIQQLLFILCGEVPVGYTHTPSGRTTNQLTTTPHPLTYMATNKAEGKGYISVVVFCCFLKKIEKEKYDMDTVEELNQSSLL